MFKWRCVLITKSGRKFVVRGFSQQDYIKALVESRNTLENANINTGGYFSLSTTRFRVQVRVSEIDCVIFRKTIFGW